MDRTADIDGDQRKLLAGAVRPVRLSHGETGLPIVNGEALPFVVERKWNAPAGYYPEQWFLIDPNTREILYEGPEKRVLIIGLATWTDVSDTSPGGFSLAPGAYQIVFALGGVQGGVVDVQAVAIEEPGKVA
jgi:hypothetical protein